MEDIKELLDIGRDEIKKSALPNEDHTLFERFVSVYTKYFRHVAPFTATCNGCFDSAFDYMEASYNSGKLKAVPVINPNNLFFVRGNGSVYSRVHNKTITNYNLIDSEVFELLAVYPSEIAAFSKFPSNWENYIPEPTNEDVEISSGEAEVTEEKPSEITEPELTKKQLQAIAKEKGISGWEKMNKTELQKALA